MASNQIGSQDEWEIIPPSAKTRPAPAVNDDEWEIIPSKSAKKKPFLSRVAEGALYSAKQVGGAAEGTVRAAAGLAGFPVGLAATLGAKTLGGKNWQEAGEVGGKVAGAIGGGATPLLPESQFYQQTLNAPFEVIGKGMEKGAEALAPNEPETQAMLQSAAGVAMLLLPFAKGEIKAKFKAKMKAGAEITPKDVAEIAKAAPDAPPEVKAKVAEVVAPPASAAKEPWQMTRKEFIAAQPKTTYRGKDTSTYSSGVYHSKAVIDALKSDKPVPPEVLADYPDLAKTAPKPDLMTPVRANYNRTLARTGVETGQITPAEAETLLREAAEMEYRPETISVAPPPAAPAKPLNLTRNEMGMTMAEFERAQARGEVMGIVAPSVDIKTPAQGLYDKLVNQFAPIERLAAGAAKAGRTLPVAKNPKNLVRSWLGEPEKIGAMLDNGIHKVNPDGTLTRMGEGLKPVLREYSEANPFKDIAVQEADLDSFLTATRTIEDLQRPKFPGAEENVVTPEQVAAARSELASLRAKYGANYSIFENTAPRVYKFENDVLDYTVDRGLYSAEEIAAIKARNPHHIPFDRIVDAGESAGIIPKQSGRFSQSGSGIKKIKGSERAIHPVVGSVVKNTYRLIDAADRNYIASSVAELADLFPDQIKIEKAQMRPINITAAEGGGEARTIFRPSQQPQTPTSIKFKAGGEYKSMSVSPQLYKAMMNMNPEHTGWLVNILALPKRWLQWGATITPDFIARNPIRDQYGAFQQTQIGFRPFWDIPKAMADVAKKGDLYNEYLMTGAPHAGIVSMNRQSLAKAYKQFVKDPSWTRRLNIFTDLQDLSEFMEKSTRFATYERARKAGKSPLEAGTISAESTVDFRVQGSDTKFFTKTVPFLNAGIQGIDRYARAYKADPLGMTAKGVATITIPSIILHEINKDNPAYRELKDWDKNLFWHIPVAGRFLRVPKPFIPGQMFGTSVERFLDYAQGRDPKAAQKMLGSLAESVSPVSGDFASGVVLAAVKPLLENLTNWSFFRDSPVVPTSKENLPPAQQYGPYTSEVAKMVGNRFNVAPAKVDNVIQGYFGGTGRYITQSADAVMKATGVVPGGFKHKRPEDISDWPVLKSFLTKPEYALGQQSIQNFYENMKQAQSWRTAINDAAKSGAGADAMARAHPEYSLALDYQRRAKDFSEMRRNMERVNEDKSLSPAQKKAKMNAMATNLVKMARDINEEFERRRKGAKR